MRLFIAILLNDEMKLDSFKGSLGSVEAGGAVREGILRVYPDADVSVFPLADGGEGTEECNARGIDAFFPIVRKPISLEQAMDPDNARRNLADTSEQVFRMIKMKGRFL